MKSRVRLDPLQHVFQLRAYSEPVDTDAPLSDMSLPYIVTGVVTVVSHCAVVEGVKGDITPEGMKDFQSKLREMGVTSVTWERHRADGTIKLVGVEI